MAQRNLHSAIQLLNYRIAQLQLPHRLKRSIQTLAYILVGRVLIFIDQPNNSLIASEAFL